MPGQNPFPALDNAVASKGKVEATRTLDVDKIEQNIIRMIAQKNAQIAQLQADIVELQAKKTKCEELKATRDV